jgi:putative FmdB family regulatory protein
MPVYEYQCKACHQEFEYQQRMSDPDKTTCEVCGGSLDRLISRTAFQLKGSGWYKDLYSSKPAAGGGKAESGTEASGSADKSASGDKGAAPASGAASETSSSGTSSAGSASSSVAASKAT